VGVADADGHEDLSDANAGNLAVGLSVSAAHAGLQTIGTGAGQHLVDTQYVVRVCPDSHVESLAPGKLHEALVGGNASGLEGLARDLLSLVRHHMYNAREIEHARPPGADIVDADLGIRHTTAEPRLDERLVLAIAVAARRACKGRVGKFIKLEPTCEPLRCFNFQFAIYLNSSCRDKLLKHAARLSRSI